MRGIHPFALGGDVVRTTFNRKFAPACAVAVLAGGLIAGCGSSGSSSGGSGGSAAAPPVKGKRGGHLTVLFSGEVDYIDPGATYYSGAFPVFEAMVRPLYGYLPDKTTIRPDLAASMPVISKDNRSVTVTIRKGVKFGPPINREITAADVKYGLERSFKPKLTNGYVSTYFAHVDGFDQVSKGKAIHASGITTPSRYKIHIQLNAPEAYTVAQALVLPASAPVPEKYAAKLDASSNPAAYGTHQISSGPYMIRTTRRAPPSATSRARRSIWSGTRTGIRRPTSGRPTSTRSRSRRTTPTRRRRRVRS